jgi:hypothetical protein
MILAPVSQQPRSLHMISACAAVPIRTNKLAMAGTIIDFIVVLLFLPFCAAEVQRDRLARVLATHISMPRVSKWERWGHSLRKSLCFPMCPGDAYWGHFAAKSAEISTNGSIRSESRCCCGFVSGGQMSRWVQTRKGSSSGIASIADMSGRCRHFAFARSG